MDGKALMYFSGWKQHVAVYPVPPVDDELAQAIAPYVSGKGTLKFPLNQPIPYELIAPRGRGLRRVTNDPVAPRDPPTVARSASSR